jgi:hypothetical protein
LPPIFFIFVGLISLAGMIRVIPFYKLLLSGTLEKLLFKEGFLGDMLPPFFFLVGLFTSN